MTANAQKVCVVTGANSGIGKAIATGLAKAGAHIIMICRDEKKGLVAQAEIKRVATNSVDLLIADFSSQADIRQLAKTINERYPALDIVINNAGVILTSKQLSVDGIEKTLATNVLAPFLFTNLLLDLLKANVPARVINISSGIYKWGKLDLNDLQYNTRKYQVMKVYAQSKLLMNILTLTLAEKLKGSGVVVNCIHPGAVNTSFGNNNANSAFLRWLSKAIKYFFITPEQAAKPIIDLALAPEYENITGQYFEKGKPVAVTNEIEDTAMAQQVWQRCEELTSPK
jgi:NAD(P)-dependent dehydrogenase (short-subunit alcohol dehydrogenase family)